MNRLTCGMALCLLSSIEAVSTCDGAELLEKVKIDTTWAGHSVGYRLETHGKKQYVGYYDAERNFTIACRELPSGAWEYKRLPSKIGWDSHNYITFTFDDEDYLHVAGNMHACPLIYFRASKPNDISTLERVPAMTGQLERRVTYPRFFRGPAKELIFTYRDGGSGNGNQIYNVYDVKTKTWKRLLDVPLTDGLNLMNAYMNGPSLGPDGFFHMVWVWRNTPSCDTNHDLSYARSRDLIHWENIEGKPITLPMSINTPGIVVDPSPEKGGMINMGINFGFDAEKRVILTYHKYDEKGFSQIYNARFENGAWNLHQATDWDWRWEFTGGGSVPCLVQGSAVSIEEDGTMVQSLSNQKKGNGLYKLDPITLKPVEKLPPRPSKLPAGWNKMESTFPGLRARLGGDTGSSGEDGIRYYMKWETRGSNRDRAFPDPQPDPSNLWLLKVKE